MPRHGERGERLAEKSGVKAHWRNPQNEVRAGSIMQLKIASYCVCIRRQMPITQTILILSLPNSKTYPLLDFFSLIVK